MGGRSSRGKRHGKTAPFTFHVYIAGQTRRSDQALARLRKICEERCPGQYEIQVIDVTSRPDLAKAHEVLATPTVLRTLPQPVRRSIGDLSNKEKALLGLDLLKIAELDASSKRSNL